MTDSQTTNDPPLAAPTGSTDWRPTTLKILNLDFSIKWIDKTTENGAQKFGWCNCNDQVIGISREIHPKKTADTFLHEVLHALNFALDIKDGSKEEEICNRLSSGICCVWIDNPKAFAWWQSLLWNVEVSEPGDRPAANATGAQPPGSLH